MKRYLSLIAVAICMLTGLFVFQNCGAPALPGSEAAPSSASSGADTTGDLGEFISTSTGDTSTQPPYAKANGMPGVVARRADEPTLWQFKMASAVLKGRTRTSDCNDPLMNSSEVEFNWANGQTEGEQLGSSSDYRRDGCRQTVCFDSATDSQCVTAAYHMQGGSYFAAANGIPGVAKVPAKNKTVWSFNVDSPVTKGTSQMSNCTDTALNAGATEFQWANGLTSMTLEGNSENALRAGCRQEVCFHTSNKKYCVTAFYQ